MKYQKDLTQIALTALILASTNSANAQNDTDADVEFLSSTGAFKAPVGASMDHSMEGDATQGIFLAVGCAAHGCPSPAPAKNGVADNKADNKKDEARTVNQNSSPINQPNSNEKNGDKDSSSENRDFSRDFSSPKYPNQGYRTQGYSTQGGYPNQDKIEKNLDRRGEVSYITTQREFYDSGYNSQRAGLTSPVYVEDYRASTFDTRPLPYPEYGGMTNFNREYNTTTDYDYNRASVTTATSNTTLTEAQLLGQLNSQGRTIYLNLDPEGKSLAIQLASQDSYRDKNLAVREAQRRMSQRRGLINR